jgi:ABC-2 type transport system ATP-binding protein
VTPSGGLCVRDLTKRYGAVTAVSGVGFDVRPGEVFGLLGPNGAGKTTILECILGLRRPDGGSIAIDGLDVLAHPASARTRVGAQLQSATLQDKITPREVLELFGSFYPHPASANELLTTFGLAAKANAPFQSLSGGQRQRLFLALALVNRPTVTVLDEPTAGLDPESRRDFHRLITGLRDAERCVMLSTHDLDEAERLCDRVAILAGGRIVLIASPSELVTRSGRSAKVYLETSCTLDAAKLQAMAGVNAMERRGPGWELDTTDAAGTVAALARAVDEANGRLVELAIRRPTLKDVYLSLTGSAWPAAENPKADESAAGRTAGSVP